MKAQAIVFPAPNRVEIQDYDVPILAPGELRVRTELSGVSQGTEIWALTGQRPEIKFPTVPGYQGVGIVEAKGEAVQNYAVGQRVWFASSRLPDGFPPTWMGAHVSHAVVPSSGNRAPLVLPFDDPALFAPAALAALPAVSLRGINMLRVQKGDLVVVTGQGLIGQGSAQWARQRGATVLATDIGKERLHRTRAAHSADTTLNVRTNDLQKAVRALKPGGADIVIETTGRSDQFAPVIDLLREQGQLLLQGWYPQPITFDFNRTHGKRPTIAITCGFDSDGVMECLRALQRGDLRFGPLITHHVSFTSAPGLYHQMRQNDPDVLGVVFDWRA